MDHADHKRFAVLYRICHVDRHGAVEGVEFDFRHEDLDPEQWGMPTIGSALSYAYRLDQPYIWFPWYGKFDAQAVRRDIKADVAKFGTSKRPIKKLLLDLTPDATVGAGDKIIIDRVEILSSGDPFSHLHDAEERRAYLKIVRGNGRTVNLAVPVRLVGHTAFMGRGTSRDMLPKIAARICEHFSFDSIEGEIADKILQSEKDGFAEGALLYLRLLLKMNKTTLANSERHKLNTEEGRAAFLTKETIENALRLGYYWARAEMELRMEPFARSGLELRTNAGRAGVASGASRRAKAEQTWKAHALELATAARASDPTLSQHRLADEIGFGWRLATKPPGHATLTAFISELEKSGRIQARKKL